MNRSRKRGFTLIELVMVIVIIGVLSAIIVPSYVDYVGKSAASTTKANLQMIRTALQTYRAEKNGAVPADGKLSADLVPNYIGEIPPDGVKSASTIVATVDGAGGWHYTGGVVKPNLKDKDAYSKDWSSY